MKTPGSAKTTGSGPTLDDLSKMRFAVEEDVTGNLKSVAKPTVEAIQARAYQIYLAEGCPEGRTLHHWLEAERQLRGAF